jgi:hypothetical protein
MRLTLLLLLAGSLASAQSGKFEQLDNLLPTPNSYRSGSGAPGPDYWQQRADYEIKAELNDDTQVITGSERITYYNNAPEPLSFLWIQLDQNILAPGNMTQKTEKGVIVDSISSKALAEISDAYDFQGGFNITAVRDDAGRPLDYFINYTMMRIDLPRPLNRGEKFTFSIDWSHVEYDRMKFDQRGGYEYFPADGNRVYTIAQWFPRLCVFDDYEGWQNKQFLGRGEFALTFGNYKVEITVPSDHIVGATGKLMNPQLVLSADEYARFQSAQASFDKPVIIVNQKEAEKKEKQRSKKKSTWIFQAENVRDFAFASSRKFIWDAQAVKIGSHTALAMSLYPKEGNPLWEKESTRAVKNALEIYSQRSVDYPYPVAYSVHAADLGMEYPMICFNFGRPNKDGSYSDRKRASMIAVIIHEVGHNFFPMIVNSDERQWGWMDEGLNTFLETETKRERYPEINIEGERPAGITRYMRGSREIMRPIMTSADNIPRRDYGPNAYDKPSAALTLLRETVMGPELFDKAFKEYSTRWAFKHPKPADFFRTMEDASAVDLDWFWRGWFYTTDAVDVTLDYVKWYRVKKETPGLETKNVTATTGDLATSGKSNDQNNLSSSPQEFTVVPTPETLYGDHRNRLDEKSLRTQLEGKNLYEVKMTNAGGLVTPVIIQWNYKDGTQEIETIPAEIWRQNDKEFTKVFVKEKEVASVVIDPKREIADIDISDNAWPRKPAESSFERMKKRK